MITKTDTRLQNWQLAPQHLKPLRLRPKPQPMEYALSNYLSVGRAYHPLCRYVFIEKRTSGYYAYERKVIWHTCAIAAAYAGAFGPGTIEQPEFSYSMAVWRLSQRLGYALGAMAVTGPTGRRQPLAGEMMQLIDENWWNRAGIVEWLRTLRL